MSGPSDRPGVREQRLRELLDAYFEAEQAGVAADRSALLSQHLDLADDLKEFFAFKEGMRVMPPRSQATFFEAKLDVEPQSFSGSPAFQPGVDVGDYTLHERIGGGGMGEVFKAWQKGSKTWVALKVVKSTRYMSPAEVRRFYYEIQAVAKLDHPCIVKIYHVSDHEGAPYFTMKLFENGSLNDRLNRFTDDRRAAARLLADVARAIHHAHQRGILHRDLKPANILLDAQDRPHVADFGLAKRVDADAPREPESDGRTSTDVPNGARVSTVSGGGVSTNAQDEQDDEGFSSPDQSAETVAFNAPPRPALTVAGTTLGTAGYLPPEQVHIAASGVSTAADVYGLGAVLYCILTGQPPFRGKDPKDTLQQVLEMPPTPPRRLNAHVEPALEAVCLKCLQKLPSDRYSSAEAVAQDLERWLKGEPPLAWRMPWRLRAWHAVRRHLLLGLFTALTGFGIAAAFFVLYFFNPDRVPNALVARANQGRVVLIGDKGHPEWSRWDIGAGTALFGHNLEKPFSLTSFEKARLELLPRAPGKSFRFSAEIKHDDVGENSAGSVGIYFARTQKPSNEGLTHFWWDLAFADRGPLSVKQDGPNGPKHGEVRLTPWRYAAGTGYFNSPSNVFQRFNSAHGKFAGSEWRQLAVTVRADDVEFFWEGASFKKMTHAQVRKLGETFESGGETAFPEIEFNPQGALGLYLYKGTASFRQVIVEPLE